MEATIASVTLGFVLIGNLVKWLEDLLGGTHLLGRLIVKHEPKWTYDYYEYNFLNLTYL